MGLFRAPGPVPTFLVPMVKFVPGTHLIRDGVYVYECPLCHHRMRFDDLYGPMCTGPDQSRDDHPPEAMRLVATDKQATFLQMTK